MNGAAVAIVVMVLLGVAACTILWFSIKPSKPHSAATLPPTTLAPPPADTCATATQGLGVSSTACAAIAPGTAVARQAALPENEASKWVNADCTVSCGTMIDTIRTYCAEHTCMSLRPYPTDGEPRDKTQWLCAAAQIMAECPYLQLLGDATSPGATDDTKAATRLACEMSQCFAEYGCRGGCGY